MDRSGIFAGEDPFALARDWLSEAEKLEPNDPNAIAFGHGRRGRPAECPMVLLKEIEADAFVFYTNYGSKKGQEIAASGKAAFVLHWNPCAARSACAGRPSARKARRPTPISPAAV